MRDISSQIKIYIERYEIKDQNKKIEPVCSKMHENFCAVMSVVFGVVFDSSDRPTQIKKKRVSLGIQPSDVVACLGCLICVRSNHFRPVWAVRQKNE